MKFYNPFFVATKKGFFIAKNSIFIIIKHMENQNKKSISLIVTIVVLALGAIGALTAAFFKGNPPQAKKENTGESIAAQNPTYKNGDYHINQSYLSPGGTEHFDVSLSLANNVVTSADFTPGAISPTGKKLQATFSQDFKQYVVGKNIDQIALSVVSGASLTSAAFNEAIAQIEEQAVN